VYYTSVQYGYGCTWKLNDDVHSRTLGYIIIIITKYYDDDGQQTVIIIIIIIIMGERTG